MYEKLEMDVVISGSLSNTVTVEKSKLFNATIESIKSYSRAITMILTKVVRI